MKQISTIAFIVLVLAAAAFFLRDRTARAELADAHKQVATLSNEVAKITTIMAMHSVTNNELKQQITKHLSALAALSNRVAKASEDITRAHQEHLTVQSDLQKETKKVAEAEGRAADLQDEVGTLLKMIEGRNIEIARLTPRLQVAEAQRAAFHERMLKAEAELVRLQLDMTDEAALRAQLKRLDKQWQPVGFARTPHVRPEDKGSKALTAKVDSPAKGYILQMQPDGTVKLLPPLEAAGRPLGESVGDQP